MYFHFPCYLGRRGEGSKLIVLSHKILFGVCTVKRVCIKSYFDFFKTCKRIYGVTVIVWIVTDDYGTTVRLGSGII